MKHLIGKILCYFIKKRIVRVRVDMSKYRIFQADIEEIVPKDSKWHTVVLRFGVKRKPEILLNDVSLWLKWFK